MSNESLAQVRQALAVNNVGKAMWLLIRIRDQNRLTALEYLWGHLGSNRMVEALRSPYAEGLWGRHGGAFTARELGFVLHLLVQDPNLDQEAYLEFMGDLDRGLVDRNTTRDDDLRETLDNALRNASDGSSPGPS